MDFKNELMQKVVKSFVPQITKVLENPETKQKLIQFINSKKETIEPLENEVDVILTIASTRNDVFFAIYTIDEKHSLVRKIGQLNYEEIISVIEKLLSEFVKPKEKQRCQKI